VLFSSFHSFLKKSLSISILFITLVGYYIQYLKYFFPKLKKITRQYAFLYGSGSPHWVCD
jgi:hypothetical protein